MDICHTSRQIPDSIFPKVATKRIQLNAQYPSGLINWIMIRGFLDRLMPCDWCFSSQYYLEFSYIQRIYLLLRKSSLCSSLDPGFHSDSILDQDRCKGNECIYILLSINKWNRKNVISTSPPLLFFTGSYGVCSCMT